MGINIYYGNIVINFIEAWMYLGFKAALYTHFLVMYFFCYMPLLLIVVISTAITTLEERKYMADIQSRRGPSKVGCFGVLQPFADAFKLLMKEYVVPHKVSSEKMFVSIAGIAFLMAAFFWNLPTMSYNNVSVLNEVTIFGSFLISLIHVFTILFAGWSSNSRYSFLGAVRSAAQLVAYDIIIILIYTNLFFYGKEFSFENLMELQYETGMTALFLPFQCFCFFLGLVAETSRHPFDFPEAESELVSGYNTEYSAIRFALFFLAEYATILYSALLMIIVFFGREDTGLYTIDIIVFCLKVFIVFAIMVQIRAQLPRYRYDQLMNICWKNLVPFQCMYLGLALFSLYFL